MFERKYNFDCFSLLDGLDFTLFFWLTEGSELIAFLLLGSRD